VTHEKALLGVADRSFPDRPVAEVPLSGILQQSEVATGSTVFGKGIIRDKVQVGENFA
jgi:hypothetical protein